MLGLNTKTPELKQSGQPTSGAAENSSLSKSSSQFTKTSVSASKKTHFSNCVNLQQCNFVNVIPNSGRDKSAKLAESFESKTSTSCTTLKTARSFSLKIFLIINFCFFFF